MSLIYSISEDSSSTTISSKQRGLYLGGKVDAKSKSTLQSMGVTHVLNVTPEKETGVKSGVPNFFESSTQIKYRRIPVYDASTSDILKYADSIVSFISTGLCHGSVLVHCQRGVSRSVTCVIFYLMRKVGMTLHDAMTLVKKRRPEADPIPAFLSQLESYEKKCRKIGVIRDDTDDHRKMERKKKKNDNNDNSSISKKRKNHDDKTDSSDSKPQQEADEKEDGNQTTRQASAQQKKQRRIIGPAMGPPPIGPAMNPSTMGWTEKRPTIIGPEIGPTMMMPTEGEKEGKKIIGPTKPPS